MSGSGREPARLRAEVAGAAGPTADVQERAAGILQQLARALPFDAGWLGLRDPERHRHVPVATVGPAGPLAAYFDRPEADEEVDRLGLNRRRPPMLAGENPVPLPEVPAWVDHLLPAGFRGGLATGLFTSGGRHVGFLSLLSADPAPPGRADRGSSRP
jgi:GAF domain-containing protein